MCSRSPLLALTMKVKSWTNIQDARLGMKDVIFKFYLKSASQETFAKP